MGVKLDLLEESYPLSGVTPLALIEFLRLLKATAVGFMKFRSSFGKVAYYYNLFGDLKAAIVLLRGFVVFFSCLKGEIRAL